MTTPIYQDKGNNRELLLGHYIHKKSTLLFSFRRNLSSAIHLTKISCVSRPEKWHRPGPSRITKINYISRFIREKRVITASFTFCHIITLLDRVNRDSYRMIYYSHDLKYFKIISACNQQLLEIYIFEELPGRIHGCGVYVSRMKYCAPC